MDIRSADWDDLNESQKVEKHYLITLESVDLINKAIAGVKLPEDPKKAVARNVEHLKIMKAKNFWQGQDMTPINNAITAGENYVAELEAS
jgi:hypothetical protein